MAYFRKRDNGWEYRISYKTPDGKYKQKSKSGFRTKNEATLAAAKAEQELSQGFVEDDNSLFSDYFIKWAELYKKPNVSPSTWLKYEYTHKKIIAYFGQAKLKTVTANSYQEAINNFRATHSWQTVKMFNTHIRQCLKMALHTGIIQKDFTIFTTLTKEKDKDLTSNYLEIDEYLKLIADTGKEITYKSHFCIYLIAVTGMRFSEAMGLTYNDIDKDNLELSINKTYKVFGVAKGYAPTKNENSVRTVPISQHTLDLLESYQSRFRDDDRILTGLSNSAVNKTLKKLVGRDVHVHSLRHTYVSYLISQGLELFAISKLIGHKDLNTTLTVYAHLLADSKDRNNQKVRQLFGADLGQNIKNP
ncbi:integrase [Streptococcus phage Javan174]|uniref:site-specific integrase n=1 Tax=Streptococcus entericus TaxID=155680 RepID=UPI0003663F65|nr:tyrosine-type recombinase/integrase [Streptococcus entericus]QBX24067.1 integrase [Streptococcus phage Javan174]